MRSLPLLLLLGGCAVEEPPVSTPLDPPPDDDSAADSATDTDDSAPDSGQNVDSGDSGDSGDPQDSADRDSGDPPDTGDSGAPPTPPAVILFIGDGMGYSHVEGGGMFANGAAGSLVMEGLPYVGRLQTASLSGVTDSAASATAMATGTKTWNDRLGLDGDGASVESLLERARARGMAVGVVTTDTLTGATPSAFTVHVADRADGASIIDGFVAELPDLAFGGGYDSFASRLDAATANVVTTDAELAAAVPDGRPLIGLFSPYTMNYVADGYAPDDPTLADMTSTALEWLDDDPEGFFLVVEGARIDHASHGNLEDNVFHEVAAFDDAVAAGVAWAGSRDVTMLVTADHECGGLDVSGPATAGTVPTTAWRWGRHTNEDVPVFGLGALTSAIDGQRLHNAWVHAILSAAIDGATSVTAPALPTLPDGATADLGAVVTTQDWATSFGAGYNQLDALRLTSDADALWIGLDGVAERDENTVLVFVDLDFGEGTGLGADADADDAVGELDGIVTAVADRLGVAVDGLGFDVVLGAVGAVYVEEGQLADDAGLRGVWGAYGSSTDFNWLATAVNFDDGNVSDGSSPAGDAGGTGLTENGAELRIQWETLFPTGLPAAGAEVAVWAVLVNTDGGWISNQALPSLDSADEPGADGVTVARVALLPVDVYGLPTSVASVMP